jgi:spore coat polysaccharide biosynthesis predicted glycosyltransferase SpsG
MLWCDLAIAASGLTKYEFAATGTPALVFSIDAIQEASNQSFAATGSVVDLGLHPTPDSIAGQTLRLLGDHPLRKTMAAAGRTLVDGAGTQRLIAELVKELKCSRAN